MKKIFLLLFVCVFLLTSCSSKVEPENIYTRLLIPEKIEFGMNSSEVAEILGATEPEWNSNLVTPPVSSTGQSLDNRIVISIVEYEFTRKEKIEFENNSELSYVKFNIIDSIKYEDRTQEKHGDIETEYANIQEFLTTTYGAPLKTTEKINVWEKDNLGVVLTLESVTNATNNGKISLVYKDTSNLKENWYEI